MKGKIALLIIALTALWGCNSLENSTDSGSTLIISSITGNDLEGNEGSTTIFSDVVTSTGGIFNDNGVAAVIARSLNPDNAAPTYYENVIVDQIDVAFYKNGSANVEGSDVPYAFSQAVNAMVEVGKTVEIPFVLIRHNAKLEAPLVHLRETYNQEKILQLTAKVTISSKDVAGHRLSPSVGYATVWCANFADVEEPEPEPEPETARVIRRSEP